MDTGIDLVRDGESLAVIGNSTDVERFLLSTGLDKAPTKEIDFHRFRGQPGLRHKSVLTSRRTRGVG